MIDLAQWRRDRRMSQQTLANLLGVHRVTIARWESGVWQVPHPLMLSLALAEIDRFRAPR